MSIDRKDLLVSAVREIRKLRQQVKALQEGRPQIAVLGMSCRFPGGAHSLEDYWDVLRRGVDGIVDTPADRWCQSQYYDPDPTAPGMMNVRAGGFLQCPLTGFDAPLFGISPREAPSLDPQQRLLLEVTWEALENAGIPPSSLRGSRTGVFVGISGQDYGKRTLSIADATRIDAYSLTGSHPSVAAGRLAYVFGFTGPAIAVDTACSSSLVALHQACESLRRHTCDVAVVAGVNALLSPDTTVALSKLRALAPDARCKTFDRSANGYVRSEGCGVVILKRLLDVRDEEGQVLAVIHGSAINQDGRSNGLTAPRGSAQEDVIRQALSDALLSSDQVGYVECHGTGTELGDAIEATSLAKVFFEGSVSRTSPLVLGAVKTNLGHLEAAAGVAGLIKAVLAVDRGMIPGNLHFNDPNPKIDWSKPFHVPTTPHEWCPEGPRFAGVSSFGFSGTNAHVIVGQSPRAPRRVDVGGEHRRGGGAVIVLSGTSAEALRTSAGRWARRIEGACPGELEDIALTAATSRERFEHSVVTRGADADEVSERLAEFSAGGMPAGCHTGISRKSEVKLGFLFTGQGSQWVGMGSGLYSQHPVFRQVVDHCASLLLRHRDVDLREVLLGEKTFNGRPLIDRTAWTQPCLFALEVALAELWRSWGVEPDVLLGHSVGEIAAAAVAETLSLPDAVALVHDRSESMDALPDGGAMASLVASEARVRDILEDHPSVSVAAINHPEQIVVSGPLAAVAQVVAAAESAGLRGRRLVVSHAFHSSLMDPMLAQFGRTIERFPLSAPSVPIVSNLSGQVAGDEFTRGDYWTRHAREPVQFAAGLKTMHEMGVRVFIECGPSATLCALGRRCVPDEGQLWLPSLGANRGDDVVLDSLCRLVAHGWPLPARQLFGPTARLVAAPTYPFQRKHYWIEAGAGVHATPNPASRSPLSDLPEAHEDLAAPAANDRAALIALVSKTAGLSLDQCSEDTDLYALGLDSLMLMDLAEHLERRLNVEVTVRMISSAASQTDAEVPKLTLGRLIDRILGLGVGDDRASVTTTEDRGFASDAPGEGPFAECLGDVAPLESGLLEIAPDVRVETLRVGEGEPLLLLPPLSGSIHHWIPLIHELGREYQVLSFNYPGCGRSTPRLEHGTLARLCSIAEIVLGRFCGDEPAHAMGWSFGGFVAQRLAATARRRLASLTLVCTTAAIGDDRSATATRAYLERLSADLADARDRVESPQRGRQISALLDSATSANSPSSFMHYAAEAARFDGRSELASIRCPTLVVSGALDMFVPPWHSARMQSQIPRAEHRVVAEGGHFIPVFHPEPLAGLFRAHVRNVAQMAREGGASGTGTHRDTAGAPGRASVEKGVG